MPAPVQSLLREMMEIAKTIPGPARRAPGDSGNGRRVKRTGDQPKRSNNRVRSEARLYMGTKNRFVTTQSSASTISTQRAMTRYPSGTSRVNTFSTHLLQGNTDCQKLLGQLTIRQGRMQGWLAYLQLEARTAVTRGQELQAQLYSVNTILQVNRELIKKFPFATGKRKLEHRNAKLHCKRLVLEDRLAHFDTAVMVLREYNINVLLKQLEVLDQLISAVEKRNGEFSKLVMIGTLLPVQTPAWSDTHCDRGITTVVPLPLLLLARPRKGDRAIIGMQFRPGGLFTVFCYYFAQAFRKTPPGQDKKRPRLFF